ncbi:MAG: ComEA family DNA-binding protein [Abditibacteriales bacterium]|nr:ComEA family DNA-binding protein [Abditibacteriales bacterium]MDW8365045.1 ComEA family DNA-binding protein [Abditibacteriales bacterium]
MFLSRTQQVLIVLSLIALASCALYGLVTYAGAYRAAKEEVKFQESPFPPIEKPETLLVHVAGRVKKPGVYELKCGARVRDALAAAQGATPDADVHALNLAAFLRDGEKIWVPSRQEAVAGTVHLEVPSAAASRVASSSSPRRAALNPSASQLKHHRINLNTATVEQLQQLPHIGPVLAERIVLYRREHGRFTRLEDLLNVPGIGEKKLARIREYITL